MAHYRKPLVAAVALNTAIFMVEAVTGFPARSYRSRNIELGRDDTHRD